MSDENIDFVYAQTGDIMVSAYPEQLESDDKTNSLWAYCLRIENNSGERIRLLQKNFCITDSRGQNHYEHTIGFHGELPDLEIGECFEYEDTVTISGGAAVLYGSCYAVNEAGKQFVIKLPLMQLTTANAFAARALH